MAVKITEPIDSNPLTKDWQDLLFKLTATTGGLLLIDYTEKQSVNVPKILTGSRFELNGTFYHVKTDEEIKEWSSLGVDQFVYVYARTVKDGTTAEFYWSNEKPTFQVAKGGYFHRLNNERAILSAYKQSNTQCRVKSLIGVVRKFDIPENKDGALVIENTNLMSVTKNIEAGWYKVVIKGGTGGNGGNGGESGLFRSSAHFLNSDSNGARQDVNSVQGMTGKTGKEANEKTFYLWLDAGTIELKAGRTGSNGNNGQNGTAPSQYADNTATVMGCGGGGNGGDGNNGEESILLNNGVIVCTAPGGIKGKGGSGAFGSRGLKYRGYSGDYPYHTWMPPPTQGADGEHSNSYLSSSVVGYITGSVAVYAL